MATGHVAGPTEVTWIGLFNDRMFEQFDDFRHRSRLRTMRSPLDRSTFEGLLAENLI
jgi:hypothetical protein